MKVFFSFVALLALLALASNDSLAADNSPQISSREREPLAKTQTKNMNYEWGGHQTPAYPAQVTTPEQGETSRKNTRDQEGKKKTTTIVIPPKRESAKDRRPGKDNYNRSVAKPEGQPSLGYPVAVPVYNQGQPPEAYGLPPRPQAEPRPKDKRPGQRATTTIVLPPRQGELSKSGLARPEDQAPPQTSVAPMVAAPPAQPVKAEKKRDRRSVEAPVVTPLPNQTTEQEFTRAYQLFDQKYQASLGKTKKELKDLWGFPMQQMGDKGEETAYGFRQRGLINRPQETGDRQTGKKKKPSYYASNSLDPSQPDQYFTCMVILWIDKGGRGVVVDGDAVGDCFMVEALSQAPSKFER